MVLSQINIVSPQLTKLILNRIEVGDCKREGLKKSGQNGIDMRCLCDFTNTKRNIKTAGRTKETRKRIKTQGIGAGTARN